MTESDLLWLYIDFNSYFASVEQQMRPHLRGRPVAVVPVETDATCAIAASYEAKAFGVSTGTPIYEAKKLCPDLVCVLARHELYVEFHHRILAEIDRHIPVTAVCSIDEMACRLMRNERSPDAVRAIAAAIKTGLAENLGAWIRCSIGAAPNRYLAKVATDLHKPDGLTLLGFDDLPGRLLPLKLNDLPGVGRRMEQRLLAAGCRSVADLWALSEPAMERLWGNVWGSRMWHLLRGADLSEPETARRTIGHSHVMAPPLREPAQAVFVARRLMAKAASRLRRMDYYACGVMLSVRLENGPRLKAEERCWRAQDTLTFQRLLNAMWARLMQTAQDRRIKQVGVVLHGLISAGDVPADLFDADLPPDLVYRVKAEKISRALDRINGRFGRDTVQLGMLPAQGRGFSGTKIAFTRIPDRSELY
jgi:DNA polymerase IV